MNFSWFQVSSSVSRAELNWERLKLPSLIICSKLSFGICMWQITGFVELAKWFEVPRDVLASFPGPTQFFVACSMEKRGKPGIFSHVSMT